MFPGRCKQPPCPALPRTPLPRHRLAQRSPHAAGRPPRGRPHREGGAGWGEPGAAGFHLLPHGGNRNCRRCRDPAGRHGAAGEVSALGASPPLALSRGEPRRALSAAEALVLLRGSPPGSCEPGGSELLLFFFFPFFFFNLFYLVAAPTSANCYKKRIKAGLATHQLPPCAGPGEVPWPKLRWCGSAGA